jgi:hypothetical protein
MPTDLEGRIAITLPSGLLGRYVQTIVRNFSVASRFPYLELNYFSNHEPAVAWLAESLDDKK